VCVVASTLMHCAKCVALTLLLLLQSATRTCLQVITKAVVPAPVASPAPTNVETGTVVTVKNRGSSCKSPGSLT
jgi:hypothetical protein